MTTLLGLDSTTIVQIRAGQHLAICIVVDDTLTDNFTIDEIETVLAHEFGHHVHKDVTTGIIVQSMLTLIGFWLANKVMNLGRVPAPRSPIHWKTGGSSKKFWPGQRF